MATLFSSDDLPQECINDMRGAGAKDEAVAHWLKDARVSALLDSVPLAAIVTCLKGTGAWDDDELSDEDQNRARLLWIMASNFADGETIFCVE